MAEYQWRNFRCYFEGRELRATIKPGTYGGYTLEVDEMWDGKRYPRFDFNYKNEAGAVRALKTRFRGAEWEELKNE